MARYATAGVASDPFFRPPTPSWTNPSNSVTGAYGAAVNQNAEDYDRIMKGYESLASDAKSSRNTANINFQPLAYRDRSYTAAPTYQASGRLTDVANRLSDMSTTGGYSEGDISNFRARGLAPIRAIYANALRNVQRQKVLQGGYSPNYGAIAAKMAREQSGIIGDKNIELNAQIADKVAQGKQFATSTLAPIAQRESELTFESQRKNADEVNRINEANIIDRNRVDELNKQIMMEIEKLNRTNRENSISQQLSATQGMANLYGTTPALTNTFGQQVLASNAQNLAGQQATANIRQNRANTGLNTIGRVASTPILPQYNNSWTLPSVTLGAARRRG